MRDTRRTFGGESAGGLARQEELVGVDEAILDCLGDEVSRTILVAGASGRKSATELTERCGVSRSTVYRRLGRLVDLGLVEERTRTDGGGRAGSSVFHTTTDHVHVGILPEGLVVEGLKEVDQVAEETPPVPWGVETELVDDDRNGPSVEVRFRLPVGRIDDLFGAWVGDDEYGDVGEGGAATTGDETA